MYVGVINPNLTFRWKKKNFKVERKKLDNLNVIKRGTNKQNYSDDLSGYLSLMNMLAQVRGLFSSVFIKVQLVLDVGKMKNINTKGILHS